MTSTIELMKVFQKLEARVTRLEEKLSVDNYECEEWNDPPVHNFFPQTPLQEWCVCKNVRNPDWRDHHE